MDSWLSQYGNAEGYRWRRNGDLFQRPLGFVSDILHFQTLVFITEQLKQYNSVNSASTLMEDSSKVVLI